MRRAHAECAVFGTLDQNAGHRPPCVRLVLLAPRDAAGFGTAVHLERGGAETLGVLTCRFGGERAARREERERRRRQCCEGRQIRPTRQLRRRGYDDRRAALGDACLERLRVGADGAIKCTSGRQRPEHAKQNPVDMVMRHARKNRRVTECIAPLLFKRMHFGVELGECLVNGLRRATAARREERQACDRIDCPRASRFGLAHRFAFQRHQIDCCEEAVVGIGQIREIPRRGVGRNDRLFAAREQGEERAGEVERIVEAQRVALCRLGLQRGSEPQRAGPEESEIKDGVGVAAHGGVIGARRDQQVMQRDHDAPEPAALGSMKKRRHAISASSNTPIST